MILDKYFNDIINTPEYYFVEHIDVIEGTTKRGSWRNTHIVPYYEYVIYLNSDNSNLISDLYDKIGTTHGILFPVREDGSPRAYYSIDHKFI